MAFKKPEPKEKAVIRSAPLATESDKTTLREAAIHSVRNQHGPYVNRLKNYEALVDDAMNQMIQAGEANKTF